MVIALEACYSGSIFDQNLLKANSNIYAITAANSNETSYSEFIQFDTYLSDVFTSNWIYSLISCEKPDSTLAEQYEIVKSKTKRSHVSQFGDLQLAKNTRLNEFLHPFDAKNLTAKCLRKSKLDKLNDTDRSISSNLDTKLSKFEYLSKDAQLTGHQNALLKQLKAGRFYLKNHFLRLGFKIANLLKLDFENLSKNDESIKDRKCYEHLVNVYHQNCYKINQHPFLSQYLHFFYKACNSLMNTSDKTIKNDQLQSLIIGECKELKHFKIQIE